METEKSLEEKAKEYVDKVYDANDWEFKKEAQRDFIAGYKQAQSEMFTKADINHLEWIYEKLEDTFPSHKDFVYMNKFRAIINKFDQQKF